jgi:hypothetical protein
MCQLKVRNVGSDGAEEQYELSLLVAQVARTGGIKTRFAESNLV